MSERYSDCFFCGGEVHEQHITREPCRVVAMYLVTTVPVCCVALVLCALGPCFSVVAADEIAVEARPIVGAIRWDAWTEWGYFQQFLQPREWRERLPFFAKELPDGSVEVRSDNQEAMDQEIAFAKKGGLDYWAFDWYHPKCEPGRKFMTRCLDLYLASAKRLEINYCLLLLGGGDDASGGNHLGPKEEWPATCDYLVQRFKDPNYQKVLGNRPLVYFFETDNWTPWWGSASAARAAWDALRAKTVSAGLGAPYIAVMVFGARTGVKLVEEWGLDAISAYANPGGNDNKEKPYAQLAELNRRFWEDCAATGKRFIPTVNAGWDYRPEKNHGFPYRNADADWFTPPSPQELAAHLDSAIQWTRKHADVCEANAVIIYAWNEINEGGWLVPTLKEGTARLDAIARLLRAGK